MTNSVEISSVEETLKQLENENKEPPKSVEELIARYAAGELGARMWLGDKADLDSDGFDKTMHRGLLRLRLLLARATGDSYAVARMQSFFFKGAELENADLRSCKLPSVVLRDANLRNASMSYTDLRSANLQGANLQGANLYQADLRGANLLDVVVDTKTSFSDVQLDYATCRPQLLAELNLTPGQRQRMKVVDDAGKIYGDYSGFWTWVHLLSLSGFLFPYAMIVFHAELYRSAATRVEMPERQETIGALIWDHMQTAGGLPIVPQTWIAELLAVFFVVYNGLRIALLYKAKSLEHAANLRGIPSPFTFKKHKIWHSAYLLAHLLFFMNVAIAISHVAIYLQQPVHVHTSAR